MVSQAGAGAGVTRLPGQRVAFHGDLRRPGGFAEYALVEDGRLDPLVARTLPLEEVPAVLDELSGRYVRGRLVYVAG
ncbi:hypothetical protein ACWD4J_01250 [Streptomyces sp. NPDC002577]